MTTAILAIDCASAILALESQRLDALYFSNRRSQEYRLMCLADIVRIRVVKDKESVSD
jgi:hypothetical protein